METNKRNTNRSRPGTYQMDFTRELPNQGLVQRRVNEYNRCLYNDVNIPSQFSEDDLLQDEIYPANSDSCAEEQGFPNANTIGTPLSASSPFNADVNQNHGCRTFSSPLPAIHDLKISKENNGHVRWNLVCSSSSLHVSIASFVEMVTFPFYY